MKTMSGLDLRDKLGSIHCPALVIYGSRDAAMVVGGRMLASGLRSAEVRVLADIGHEVFLETPAEAFGIIRDFLRPD
jgi:pimeloyl-ACP methyl ester carboxylesterase